MKQLEKLIKEKGLTEEFVISMITGLDDSPAQDFYQTVVAASRQINEYIRNKTLNLDDAYQKSLLRLLEVGDKVSKTIAAAKLEAYPTAAVVAPDEEMSIADTMAHGNNKK